MILSMSLFTGVFAADEVVINDSFENGVGEAWEYANDYAKSNIKVDSTTAADGSKSLLFDDDTDKTSPILYSKKIDSKEGDVFDVSASFKLVEGARVAVFIKFSDAAGKQLSSASIGSTATDWTSASKTVTAPAGTAKFLGNK